MTQVEKNAFTKSGNSITDITTYFIGSVLSGGGGGPNGAGGTATQWADMTDNFQGYALQTRLGIPLNTTTCMAQRSFRMKSGWEPCMILP